MLPPGHLPASSASTWQQPFLVLGPERLPSHLVQHSTQNSIRWGGTAGAMAARRKERMSGIQIAEPGDTAAFVTAAGWLAGMATGRPSTTCTTLRRSRSSSRERSHRRRRRSRSRSRGRSSSSDRGYHHRRRHSSSHSRSRSRSPGRGWRHHGHRRSVSPRHQTQHHSWHPHPGPGNGGSAQGWCPV